MKNKVISTESAPSAIGPYSQAIKKDFCVGSTTSKSTNWRNSRKHYRTNETVFE